MRLSFAAKSCFCFTSKTDKAVKKEKRSLQLRFGLITLIVLSGALSRLLPHPPNFTPIGAIALFGAAYFANRYVALLIPLVSLWVSDLVINNVVYAQYFEGFVFFHTGFYWTYLSFILIGLLGFFLLKKIKVQNLLAASVLSSLLFFLLSNFGVWAGGGMYPATFNGLLLCYSAALPFFVSTLLGNLFYTGVFFGLFEVILNKYSRLQLSVVSGEDGFIQQRNKM